MSIAPKLDVFCNDKECEDILSLTSPIMSEEAEKAVDEICFGVNKANVSDKMRKSELVAYINICTLENENYCVRLTAKGYHIVANQFDTHDQRVEQLSYEKHLCFESINSLMNVISPLYVQKFNEKLAEKLKTLVE